MTSEKKKRQNKTVFKIEFFINQLSTFEMTKKSTVSVPGMLTGRPLPSEL